MPHSLPLPLEQGFAMVKPKISCSVVGRPSFERHEDACAAYCIRTSTIAWKRTSTNAAFAGTEVCCVEYIEGGLRVRAAVGEGRCGRGPSPRCRLQAISGLDGTRSAATFPGSIAPTADEAQASLAGLSCNAYGDGAAPRCCLATTV